MKRVIRIASICSILISLPALADSMQPGQWKVTTQGTTIQNGTEIPITAVTTEMCITPEMAKETTTDPLPPQQPGCQFEKLDQSETGVLIRSTCPGLISESRRTWSANGYQSVTHVEADQAGVKVVNNVTTRGERIGECPQ